MRRIVFTILLFSTFPIVAFAQQSGIYSQYMFNGLAINPAYAGKPYRYSWAMTNKPGWFLFDGMTRLDAETGEKQVFRFPDGVFASESPMAPRLNSTAEDDGYVVTFVSDMNSDSSAAWIFDAADITTGPIAQLALPERICSGTHSYWAGRASLSEV